MADESESRIVYCDDMTNRLGGMRIDTASRFIKAAPRTIYQALLDPEAVATWRPPQGMTARIYAFDPRQGGAFRMALAYKDTKHAVRGKTSEHTDIVQGQFLELVPDQHLVELIEFESDDPAFAGEMTITTTLAALPGGTEVTITCANVPEGIAPGDLTRPV